MSSFSPQHHDDQELITETKEEESRDDTSLSIEQEDQSDLSPPPKSPFFKTRLFLILFVAAIIVTLFIFAVVLFGLISKPANVTKPPNGTRNATNVPLELIDDYIKEILDFGTRIPGSEGSKKTEQMITRVLGKSGLWNIEYDRFQALTPTLGMLNFTNIIATFQNSPPRKRQQEPQRKRLVVAAHYDSKYFAPSDQVYLGATDSVVPCAMMLHMAQVYENMAANTTTTPHFDMQFVFFDGEEAVALWSPSDSICKLKVIYS